MSQFLDALLRLWVEPPDQRADAEADFRSMYAEPVLVNGAPLLVADLVARAHALHQSLTGLQIEIVHHIEVPGQVAVAFILRGRHDRPWRTPLGDVPATGQTVELRVMDVLTVVDGKVADVWVISDDLAVLRELRAVALIRPSA
ncbi:MAG TPA: ester cyclase [Micromonosporaceae bacterium]